jgi:allophanate hydrolase
MWNSFRQTPPFEPGHPWLLRHFDQIRFVEVSEQELLEARDAFPHGKYPLRIEETEFSLPAYRAFCAENQAGIEAFQTTQRAAFAAERQDWAEKGLNSFEEPDQAPPPEEAPLLAGARGIAAPVPGSVWQVLAEPGEKISAGDCVMIIESMKMEVRVLAAASGFIESIAAVPGQVVRAGQRLGVITAERRAIPDLLEISSIHAAYRSGALTPVMLFKTLLKRIDSYPDEAVFIDRIPPETVLEQAASLDLARLDKLPLFGIPFVVKDNIDVAGIPTTAACPAFSYMPAHDAHVVAKLRAAGAIVLGKANLDQFATGLNGTRSPYGAPRSVFNPDYISGGSSSGSAVAVGAGLAVFSLGTDTAGSGRVPAMFNNLIGLKPSIGRISATGVVPACKSLDCVSVFANSVADAMTVLKVAEGLDEADAYSRSPANVQLPPKPRLGVLAPKDRDFAGDLEAELLYDKALETAKSLGWRLTLIDYAPFRDIAAALYGGVFVAERLAAIKDFFATNADDINDVVRGIIAGAEKFSAADAFSDIYKLQALRRVASAELAKCDALLLPTAPTIYTVADMLEQPLALNARLGLYTNFVNLLDLAAIALPAGFRPDGLPFGITFIGPAFSEHSLAAYADQLHHELGSGAGKNRIAPAAVYAPPAADEITIVVAGAHLSGMVLNPELLALEARLVAATTTAPEYKLFALATTPPKPGLVRTPNFAGPGIAVEVWSLSAEKFGHFVAALPAPMGIGKVTLADGSVHPGFLCEAHALDGAKDITAFGGWRKYLSG